MKRVFVTLSYSKYMDVKEFADKTNGSISDVANIAVFTYLNAKCGWGESYTPDPIEYSGAFVGNNKGFKVAVVEFEDDRYEDLVNYSNKISKPVKLIVAKAIWEYLNVEFGWGYKSEILG